MEDNPVRGSPVNWIFGPGFLYSAPIDTSSDNPASASASITSDGGYTASASAQEAYQINATSVHFTGSLTLSSTSYTGAFPAITASPSVYPSPPHPGFGSAGGGAQFTGSITSTAPALISVQGVLSNASFGVSDENNTVVFSDPPSAPGASISATGTATGTFRVAPGETYSFGATADLNPSSYDITLTVINSSDLSGTVVAGAESAPPSSISPGDSAPISFNLHNSGPDEAIGTYSVAFQLVPQSGDSAINVGSVSGLIDLASGATTLTALSSTVDVPASTPSGNYDLVATLSDGGGIIDIDTSDKTFSTQIKVTGGSDLTGSFASGPLSTLSVYPPSEQTEPNLFPGESGTVPFTLSNAAGADVAEGTASTHFYLETAPSLGNGDIPISDPSLGESDAPATTDVNLQGGQTSEQQKFHFTIPASVARGNYYIVGKVTPDSGINDPNTTDKAFSEEVRISVLTPGKLSNDVYLGSVFSAGAGDYKEVDNNLTSPITVADPGFFAIAYANSDDSQIVIAFRGTVIVNPQHQDPLEVLEMFKNLFADSSFASTTPSAVLTSDISAAAMFVQKVHQEFPHAHLALTGHSLGGGIAQLVGAASGLLTVTFNAPGGAQLESALAGQFAPVAPKLDSGQTNTNYRYFGEQVSAVGEPIGTAVTLPDPIGTNFVPLPDPRLDFIKNFPTYLDLHFMNTVLLALENNSPAYSAANEPNDAAALDDWVRPSSSLIPGEGQVVDSIVVAVTSALGVLIDPSGGSDYVLNAQSGSPNLTSITVPAFSGIASYSVRSHSASGWSSFEAVQPGTQDAFGSGADGVEFQPLDSNGQGVALPNGFPFDATFDSSGTFNGTLKVTGLGPSVAAGVLAPTIVRTTDPKSVIARKQTRGMTMINVANESQSLFKGNAKITVYASSDGAIDNSSISIGSVERHIDLKAGGSMKLTVPSTIAATLQSGSYTLLAQVTDAAGYTNASSTGPAINLAAPVTSLGISSIALVPATLKPGQAAILSFTVSNSGNVDSSGPATIELGESKDGVTRSDSLATIKRNLRIRAGGSATCRMRVVIPKTASAGTFASFVSLALGGVSASAAGLPGSLIID